MSSPSVQFLRLPNGRRLAYTAHGSGPALVCPAWWVSHLEEDWQEEGFRQLFGGLAEHCTVVRYDRPGSGLSDRERERVDQDSEVETLEALVAHLQLETLSLFAFSCAGPTALSFAARHPQKVDSLVFFGSFLRGSDVGPTQIKDALQGLVRAHWGMGSKLITNLFAPDLGDEVVKALDRRYRRTASAEMAAELLALTFDMNAEEAASRVDARVLVLHRKGDRTIRYEAGRELAASLPGAAFETLDGKAHVPWLGNVEQVVEAVLGFLGAERAQEEQAPAGNQFCRKGDVWTLRFDGRTIHLKDARGLSDLAILLGSPGEEVHVGVLWSGSDSSLALGSSDPVLDDQALASYRERFHELEGLIEEASSQGNPAVRERLEDERESLAKELRSAVGLAGRKRDFNKPSERARKAVGARIRATIKKIGEADEGLGRHFAESVTTGNFCAYSPAEAISWELRSED